ncbi:MAG: hypothetical protein ABI840_01625 [bacterium]
MYTHELINLLKTFTDKEMMWFLKFLKSPYFNNSVRITKLFQVLKRYYPDFDSKNFSKEAIFKGVYGKQPYNDSTFRNLMSDLLKLALIFLKQEGIEKNDVESSFFLTTELFNRGAYLLFRHQMDNNRESLKRKNKIDGDYFFNSYKIITDSFYVNLLTQKILKKQYVVTESEKMINGIVYILSYFILETIKHNDNLLKYSRSYNIKKNIDTVAQFLEIFNFEKLILYIRNNSSLKIPVIEVYYNLLKAFTNFEIENYYIEFKTSLLSNSKYLGLNDNNFLFSRLIDYCVLKMNRGMQTSFNIQLEIFELNEIYIKKGYYKTESNKHLQFDIYRNILLNCIAVKKLEYMEEFINIYSKKLLPKQVSGVENYSLALLFFEKRFFDKALMHLNKIKFDQFVFKIDMKNLQLKINYELEYFESAISIIDTYKHFLKNNVLISESRRILHNNFVNYTYNLIQFRTGSKKINLSYISNKIDKSKNVFDKGWLLEKLNDQIGKKQILKNDFNQ